MIIRRKTLILLLIFIAVGAFLRLWHIEPGLHFAADEVRDLQLMEESWKSGVIPLLGPELRGTGFHNGPFFYHLMTLPNAATGFQPVTGAVVIALISIATIPLVYVAGRLFFSSTAGLIAAGLYTISPLIIHHSRWAWNPHPLPFVVLLLLIGIGIMRKNTDPSLRRWILLLMAVLLGISVQLHLSSLVLVALVALAWPILKLPKPKWYDVLIGVGLILLLALLPLLFYEATVGGNLENLSTLSEVHGNTSVFSRLFQTIPLAWFDTFGDLLLPNAPTVVSALVFFLFLGLFFFLPVSSFKDGQIRVKIFFLTWLVLMLASLTFSEAIVQYYFVGFFPWAFLIVGAVLAAHTRFVPKIAVSFVIIIILALTGIRLTAFYSHIISDTPEAYLVTQNTLRNVTSYIIESSKGTPFTIEVIRKHEYYPAYVYFLEKAGHPISEEADQTFIIAQPSDTEIEFSQLLESYIIESDIIFGNTRVLHLVQIL